MTSDRDALPASRRRTGEAQAPARIPAAFGDPLSELPETARKLLLAAKRISGGDGVGAHTLSRVAAESGEDKAMISCYFGNRAGLVAAVLHSVIHDEYVVARRPMKGLDSEQRRERLAREMQQMSGAADESLVFFELPRTSCGMRCCGERSPSSAAGNGTPSSSGSASAGPTRPARAPICWA